MQKKESKSKLVVLSGAGISAESGLGTFRDTGGLWDTYDINEVATPEAWENNPSLVLEFYNVRRDLVRRANPNEAHYALAQLEDHFDVTIITQNIDDLHERAGSSNVLHLHGEILKAQCSVNVEEVVELKEENIELGLLSKSGYQLRPHVVWFGEPVPKMYEAEQYVTDCNYFLVIGTSLNVYPAANLLYACNNNVEKHLVDLKTFSDIKYNNLQQWSGKATTKVPELVNYLINTQKP